MIPWLFFFMVLLGSALMVFNIYAYIRFARYVRALNIAEVRDDALRFPIVLLVLFLLGYVSLGLFSEPNLVLGGVLFGGSVFVYVMVRLLRQVTQQVVEGEQLKARLTAAQETNRAKTSFLASVSHEMRTPMNVILGMDGIALKNPDLPQETRTQLETIGHSARHLLGLINNILDINSIDAGALTVKQEPFSLAEMLSQLNALAQGLCEEKGLTYAGSVPGKLGLRYRGDDMKLKQVLLSILENAVKYTDAPGTVSFCVQCTEETEDTRTLAFTVTDTGCGIDGAFLPKLFEVFTQEDASATNRYGGGGLSLALAKRVVERMGGSIAVEREKGRGSTFTVTVPLGYEVLAAEPAPAEEPEELSLAGRRVLIVEDLPANAEIVADLLELEDVESEHAENGQIGLDMFRSAPAGTYDAILMDLRMPVMDGLAATRAIRALPRPDAKRIPIIALTANAFESDVQQSLEAGMNAHLPKPADAEVLYMTLKRLIQIAERAERSETL